MKSRILVGGKDINSLAVGIILSGFFLLCVGQTIAQRDDLPTRTGAIAGNAFVNGNFETINVTNGNLSIDFPLGSLPGGRNGSSASYGLTYNSKLFERFNAQLRKYDEECKIVLYGEHGLYECPKFDATIIAPKEDAGWQYTGVYRLDFENRLDIRTKFTTNDIAGSSNPWPSCVDTWGQTPWWNQETYIWKLRLVTPDGSSHEMRPLGHNDLLSDGFFRVRPDGLLERCGNYPDTNPEPLVYYSFDGSYLRLEKTSETDWIIYMADGSKIINTSSYQRVYDRNGNYVEYALDSRTDQFGRSVTKSGSPNKVTLHGVDGEDVEWTIEWKTIVVKKSYDACSDLDCPSGEVTRVINEPMQVVSKIIQPEQLGSGEYVFTYNAPDQDQAHLYTESVGWGEISGVTLPTGAEIAYEYDLDEVYGPVDLLELDRILNNHPVQKTLTYDAEYDGSSTPVTETWHYESGYTEGTITNPDGSWTQMSFHSTFTPSSLSGLTYKTESSDGTKVENIWAKNIPYGCTGACPNFSPANAYLKTSFTSTKDSSGNYTLTAIKDFTYDKNGNITEVREYDWVDYSSVPRAYGAPTGMPSGISSYLKRITKTAYYNDTPNLPSVDNTDTDIYVYPSSPRLLRLPKSVEVQDGSSVTRSKTEITYDYINYNSSNTKAGNPTLTRAWDSTKNTITTPLTDSNSVKTQATYNAYGMPLTTTDANGTLTQITYGNITTPTGTVSDLYPTQTVVAYGTALARTSTVTYDFFTGVVLSATDEDNDVTVVTEYDDLGRPVKVRNAYGTALESWTTTEYHDEDRYVVVRSDLNTKGDGQKVAIQHFDELGRVRLARTLEVPGAESPYNEQHGIKVQTRYKASGECTFDDQETCSFQLTSNPYRAATSGAATGEETMGWTLSQGRNDGRYSEVETFAGAALPEPFAVSSPNTNSSGVVRSSTDANTSTVEDQAGKKRRSITNALGQLIRIDEPDGTGDLGSVSSPEQPTYYYYNTLGKMVRVNQGAQNRYFMHDSLGRLLRVRQPEQEVNTNLNTSGNPDNNSWTAGFTYDNNGNVLTATDAMGTTITNTYDALNRVTQRSYNDSPQTPTVNFYYDGNGLPAVPDNSIGKLTKVTSSVSESRYTEFDFAGRLKEFRQITDGETYTSKYTYNLSGALVEEEYPSGRVVKNVLDNNGDLSIVQSRKNSNHGFWNYADHFTYNAAGAITKMQLGNGLWETAQFNARLQSTQLGLGTIPTGASLWKVDYEFGELQTNGTVDATKNTGNIGRQTLTVPGTSFVQSYKYDPLHRLIEAVEKKDTTTNWSQEFEYDRYGNRIGIDQAIGLQTLTTTPAVDPNTNRFTSNDFSYDKNGNIVEDVDVISSLPREFIFNGDNKQVEVKKDGITIGRYYYDGEGKRVKKVTDTETTVFVYSSGKLIAEYSTQLSTTPSVAYTTTDHLGSPRIITNELGQVKSRRDFMPFGEELYTGIGDRTGDAGLKYSSSEDEVRQKFTGYQKDNETNLDFAEARMYQNLHGRFTAVDPLLASGKSSDPQSFNRYVYVRNSPLVMIDPSGLMGDYFSYNGEWLGHDGKDDGKVYFARLMEQEGEDVHLYKDSIRETTLDVVILAANHAAAMTQGSDDPIQDLVQSTGQNLSDSITGLRIGARNAVTGGANALTNPLGPVGSMVGVPNPLEIAPLEPDNAKQAAYAMIAETGITAAATAGVGAAAAGPSSAGSSLSVVPESTRATVHGASRILGRGLSDADLAVTRSGSQMLQKDGARVFLKETSPGRYNWLVEGNRGVVSVGKGWSWKSVSRMATNYQWYSPLK